MSDLEQEIMIDEILNALPPDPEKSAQRFSLFRAVGSEHTPPREGSMIVGMEWAKFLDALDQAKCNGLVYFSTRKDSENNVFIGNAGMERVGYKLRARVVNGIFGERWVKEEKTSEP